MDDTKKEQTAAHKKFEKPVPETVASVADLHGEEDFQKLLTEHEKLKTDHFKTTQELVAAMETKGHLLQMVKQAKSDMDAFINQCDREGLGMATVTDHRKRIEKFFQIYNSSRSLS